MLQSYSIGNVENDTKMSINNNKKKALNIRSISNVRKNLNNNSKKLADYYVNSIIYEQYWGIVC